MNPCKITEDLLPLYVDNSLNDDSREFVEQHLKECESCRKLHSVMTKTVRMMLDNQSSKKSFRSFKRKLFWKRFPTILLCSIASLIILTAILYKPIDNFLNAERNAPMAPVQTEFSKLSNGDICMWLNYNDNLHIHTYRHTVDPYEPNILYITPKYTLMWQISEFWNNFISFSGSPNGNWPFPSVFTTNESVKNYRIEPEEGLRLYVDEHTSTYGPFTKVILRGSDGERIIWEEGDELSPADARSEKESEYWQERIVAYFSATLSPDYPTRTPAPLVTPIPSDSPASLPAGSPQPTVPSATAGIP